MDDLNVPDRPTLDDAALYGLPGDVVRTIRPHSEADDAALLLLFLASLGNAVGRGPHARAEADEHPPRLNIVLVGETSKARKGTAQGRINSLTRIADPNWVDNHVTSGLSSGEGLINRVRDGVGEDPGIGDKRLLVVEEEFARVLSMSARDGSILRDVLRQAWDGRTMSTLTRSNSITASKPHISVVGHITAEELRDRLPRLDTANGFANRFLFVWVSRSKLIPRGSGTLDLGDLGSRTRRALETAKGIGELSFDQGAGELWDELYTEMGDDEVDGIVGALIARDSAHVLRLAVAYAISDAPSSVITSEHLRAAWAVWQYCRASVRTIFGDSSGDRNYERLLSAIREAPGQKLDGRQQHGVFSRHLSQDEIERLRAMGERRGELITVSLPGADGGRPREVTYAVTAEPADCG